VAPPGVTPEPDGEEAVGTSQPNAEAQAIDRQSPTIDNGNELVATADMDDLIDRLQEMGTSGPVVGLSVGEGGGASALAVAFELSGELQSLGARVLLVDAAVNEPMLHSLLRFDPGPGLADVLSGRNPLRKAARALAGIDGLDTLTIGNIDPTTIVAISGPPFERLLAEARAAYHLVLVVSGTVYDNATVPALASLADGIILSTARHAGQEADPELNIRMDALPTPALGLISAVSAAARLEEAIVAASSV
jgi:Mrp family chromosome partitioning ATPase